MRITEGMRGGDLEDLVLPLISVDEYESKVDDDAIVVAFFVQDHDAARDLNRFIQKSPTMILDTDVSPAPDQRGYYLVFFELLGNERVGENIADILDEVSPLANIDQWQMRIRGLDRLVTFSEQAVMSHFEDRVEDDKSEKTKTDESIMTFLQPVDVERVVAHNDRLVLEGFGFREEYDIVAFGPLDKILEEQDVTVGASDVGFAAAAHAGRMNRRLGEGWSVTRINGMELLTRWDSENVLLIKNKN